MKIALMLESDGPGGAEQMLLGLARGLSARGHEVVPILPEDGVGWLGRRMREEGIEPETFRLSSPFDPGCVSRLRRLFRQRGIDIVHAHEFSMAVYGGAAARLVRCPYLITMHGSRYYAEHTRRRLALGWVVSGAAAAVGVSRATASDLEQVLRLRQGTIQVVPNGHRLPVGSGERIREQLGLGAADPLLVSVGNLYPVKGHHLLLDALAGLREHPIGRRAHLAIVGRGDERDQLQQQAFDLDIQDRLHLLGFRSDVADILAAADIFALPSLSEGLPLALLEAMFCAKPIVATRVGGIPEVVDDGVHALLVEPSSASDLQVAIERLLADGSLGARLGQAALERAECRYSPEAMTEAYERLYDAALRTSTHRVRAWKESRA